MNASGPSLASSVRMVSSAFAFSIATSTTRDNLTSLDCDVAGGPCGVHTSGSISWRWLWTSRRIDHIEVWRLQPLDVRTTTTVVSIYAPTEPHSERSRSYYIKNLELLLHVTHEEDFALMNTIQTHFGSGLLPHVVYGRNDAPLVHLHQSINQALA